MDRIGVERDMVMLRWLLPLGALFVLGACVTKFEEQCSVDGDCKGALVCVDQFCDVPKQGGACDQGCEPGWVCGADGAVCVPYCESMAQCEGGQVCHPERGYCVDSECQSVNDCDADEVCLDQVCVSRFEMSCGYDEEDDDWWCPGDLVCDDFVMACVSRCEGADDCRAEMRCDEERGHCAPCQPYACEEGARCAPTDCRDAAQPGPCFFCEQDEGCVADGECPSDQACIAGECVVAFEDRRCGGDQTCPDGYGCDRFNDCRPICDDDGDCAGIERCGAGLCQMVLCGEGALVPGGNGELNEACHRDDEAGTAGECVSLPRCIDEDDRQCPMRHLEPTLGLCRAVGELSAGARCESTMYQPVEARDACAAGLVCMGDISLSDMVPPAANVTRGTCQYSCDPDEMFSCARHDLGDATEYECVDLSTPIGAGAKLVRGVCVATRDRCDIVRRPCSTPGVRCVPLQFGSTEGFCDLPGLAVPGEWCEIAQDCHDTAFCADVGDGYGPRCVPLCEGDESDCGPEGMGTCYYMDPRANYGFCVVRQGF